jgi:hypothetical protein
VPDAAAAPLPRLAGPTRQRRPGLVAVTAVLVVGFALAGVVLVVRAGRTVAVLAVARAVPAGQRLAAADLTTARVGGTGFAAISAADRGSVVGQTAAAPLAAGQLLVRQMLTGEPLPGPGMASVGLSLRAGQLPGDGLAPGDRVRAVAVSGRSTGGSDPVSARPLPLATEATVFSVGPDPGAAGGTVVTVLVPAGQADLLAVYGSAGQVGLVEVAR